MEDSKNVDLPMDVNPILTKQFYQRTDEEKLKMSKILYQELVGYAISEVQELSNIIEDEDCNSSGSIGVWN